jgi:8-oxo-dGTP diphosphatase
MQRSEDLHECVAFMLIRDGKVLAEKRKSTKEIYPGIVAIPGGHVEKGETIHGACCREASEELGIVLGDTKYVCSLLYRIDVLYRIHYFAVESWAGEIQSHEAESLLWIPFDQLEWFEFGIDRTAIGEYLRVYT